MDPLVLSVLDVIKKYGHPVEMVATRKRRQNGGDGNSYSFGAAVAPGAPYASEVVQGSACMAAARPGMISGYSPPGLGGLPGMAGGRRRSKRRGTKRSKRTKSKRRGTKRGKRRGTKRTKRQRGGRYMVAPAAYPADSSSGPNVFAPVIKGNSCESQIGGGADTLAYSAPTAGYTNQPSPWVASTGAPVLIQAPYEARSMNPACIKTGGGTKHGGKRRGTKRAKRTKRSRGSKRKH